jgi:hypothetical protein
MRRKKPVLRGRAPVKGFGDEQPERRPRFDGVAEVGQAARALAQANIEHVECERLAGAAAQG